MKANKREIEEFFSRGVLEFIDPGNSFKEKLFQKIEGNYKDDIFVKFGIDPTRPDIHIGHAVVFRKLRQLQDWGCKIIFLIGDYTAQIGDPTGKDKTRPEVEQKEVEENLKTYLEQCKQILKTEKQYFSWIRNSDWLTAITDLNLPEDYKVNFEVKNKSEKISVAIKPNSFIGKAIVFEKTRMQVSESKEGRISVTTLRSFLWGLKHLTLSRLIERDMFQKRIKEGREIYMHELMYPVLQGIDSQVLAQVYGSCDLEVGGSDQLFNMLLGRDIMKVNKLPEQSVLAFSLLEGVDGNEKMSKSSDNYIGISESARDIFGKTMSIPDSSIVNYFTLATYTPVSEIQEIEKSLKDEDVNPMDIKLRLAEEIATIYHGKEEAKSAKESFLKTFQKKEVPEDLEKIKIETGSLLVDVLLENGIVKSKTEFRRLVEEGAISELNSGEKINDLQFSISSDSVFRIGKKRFLSVSLS